MTSGVRLDADNPWPGLESYDEASREWFKGREEETEALLRLVEREVLSVLYGRSGLGKTSLVQAGLFPRLRKADYLPIRIHLVLADDALGLRQQIGDAIARECAQYQVEAPRYDGQATLWEFFYDKDCEFWSADDHLLTPLLVFDQFEEFFTLGRENPERQERCEALLAEMGELVENRRPLALRQRLEAEPEIADRFDARRSPPKLLFCFREDYLADFDNLNAYLRARTSNRLRLLPMHGSRAKAAIVDASPERVTPEVAEQIVRFIDPRHRPLEHLIVEPALLSLVCQKLNERRRERGESQISADPLKDGSAQAILMQFYEDTFAGLDRRVRDFVEDRLLTASGNRDSCALDNALATPGVDNAALHTLMNRRLLRREDHDGRVRLELIHDVLAPVVQASRNARLEWAKWRALRQRKQAIWILLVVVALTSFGVFVAHSRKASRQLSTKLVHYARLAIGEGHHERAARLAALAAREGLLDIADPAAAPTLAAAARNLAAGVGIITSLELAGEVSGAMFDASGERVLSWGRDGTVRVSDAATGREIAVSTHRGEVRGAIFDATGQYVLSWRGNGIVRIWNAVTGAEIAAYTKGSIKGAMFDTAGERVLSWGDDGIARVWNAATGHEIAAVSTHGREVGGAMFDATGERVLFWSDDGIARVWKAANGEEIAHSEHEDGVLGATFDAPGQRVLSWDIDGIARVWDAATGEEIAHSKHESGVFGATFDATGQRVLSWSDDEMARVWNAATGAEVATFKYQGSIADAIFDASGARVLSFDGGSMQVWDLAMGAVIGLHAEKWIEGAVLDPLGERVLSWSTDGTVRVWNMDVSWSVPRPSNRALIDEVCERILRGPETSLDVDGKPIPTSLRHISKADADFAPILRDRIGEDVCASPFWW